jgi:hypothetical protein
LVANAIPALLSLLDFTTNEVQDDVGFWEILTALGTTAAAGAAVYFGAIQHLLRRPNISIAFDSNDRTDAQIVGTTSGKKAAYARLRVENKGNEAARDVEILIWRIRDTHEFMKFEPPNLSGMMLTVSNKIPATNSVVVPPRAARHIDFVHVEENSPRFEIDVFPSPVDGRNRPEAYEWEFELLLSAHNSKSKLYCTTVLWDACWDEEALWREHFKVSCPREIASDRRWSRFWRKK